MHFFKITAVFDHTAIDKMWCTGLRKCSKSGGIYSNHLLIHIISIIWLKYDITLWAFDMTITQQAEPNDKVTNYPLSVSPSSYQIMSDISQTVFDPTVWTSLSPPEAASHIKPRGVQIFVMMHIDTPSRCHFSVRDSNKAVSRAAPLPLLFPSGPLRTVHSSMTP